MKLIALLGLLYCAIGSACGQVKNNINLELLGRGFLFGSMSYEQHFNSQFAIGGGFGVANISKGEILRDNNGALENGLYFDTSTSQQLYLNYFIGKRKHKLLTSAGVSHLLSTSRNKYPSETVRLWDSDFLPNIGLGYQFQGKKVYGRLTAYMFRMPQPSGWFPEYMPWAGLSIGYRIGK